MEQITAIGNTIIANPWVKWAAKLHIHEDCCCYFLHTKTGVHIISIGLLLSLAEEYLAPNFLRGMCKLAIIVPMVLMYIRDSTFHRWLLLLLFCICQPLVALVNFLAYGNILVDNVMFAKEFCMMSQEWTHQMGSDKEREEADPCDNGEEEDDCEADKDQCPVLPGGVLKVLFVITPLVVILNVHFAFVLYTHYRNSNLTEEMGGCNDRYAPEPDDLGDD